MTEFSPATQAVWDAAYNTPEDCPYEHDLAAALEAVADQVVPEPDDWDKDNFSVQALRLRCLVRGQLLAIAAELRGGPPMTHPLADEARAYLAQPELEGPTVMEIIELAEEVA